MAFSLFLVFCIFFILEIYLNAFYINSLIIPFSLAFLFLFYFYKAFPLKVEKKISFLVILVVLILYVIGFYFGEDFLSDDYFYHLNITFPILFYKNVLLKEPFSLNNYSLGYPKFSEFLGAFCLYIWKLQSFFYSKPYSYISKLLSFSFNI